MLVPPSLGLGYLISPELQTVSRRHELPRPQGLPLLCNTGAGGLAEAGSGGHGDQPHRDCAHQDSRVPFSAGSLLWQSTPSRAHHWRLQVACAALGSCRAGRSQKTHHYGRLLTCNSPCRGSWQRAFGGFGTASREGG